jgi:hypothetical protein
MLEPVIIRLRQFGQAQQCIRHAPHRRNDNTNAPIRIPEQDLSHATKAAGVRQAAATKLVDFPTTLQRLVPCEINE